MNCFVLLWFIRRVYIFVYKALMDIALQKCYVVVVVVVVVVVIFVSTSHDLLTTWIISFLPVSDWGHEVVRLVNAELSPIPCQYDFKS